MIYINARSVIANFEKIEVLTNKYKPKIIMCTEARINEQITSSEYKIDGYKCVECWSQNRHTGGVIIYIKSNIKHKIILNSSIDKMLWILAVELWNGVTPGIYTVFYRSPNQLNNTEIALTEIEDAFDKIINLNKFNIIAGDLNIDMNKENKYRKIAIDLFDKYELTLNNKFITRENNNNGTLIDVILTNKNDMILSDVLENEKITDHNTINILFNQDNDINSKKINIISWKNYNKENLITNLRRCDWSNIDNLDIDGKIKLIRGNLFKSVFPLTKIVKIKNGMKPNKWFDAECSGTKKSKINAYNKWKNSGKSDSDWTEYVNIRTCYNKLLRDKKANQVKTDFREAGKNQNKMWKQINSMISNKSMITSDEISFEGKPHRDNKNIADEFNKYFINSIKSINAKIPQSNGCYNTVNVNNNKFNIRPVQIDDLINSAKMIKKKINKSVYCNSMVWLDAMDYIGHFMTCIMNEVIETGVIPRAWKISTITPIPKIKNTAKAEEFRPINTTDVDEKIFELIVKNQLVNFIEENQILAKTQSAFRAKHSCETAINYLINNWKEAIDKGETVIAVFLDLKRAFETVDRKRMIDKLKNYGIEGKELKLFENYMADRRQKVKYNGDISEELEIPIGLPQGTALSVILFILYINDIVKIGQHSQIALFADDTAITVTDRNANNAINKMNHDLKLIYNWLNTNKLMLNVNKTKWIKISNNKINDVNCTNKVKIGDEEIEQVKCIKYLGIQIDDNLKMDSQINQLIKNTAKKINLLKRISHKLTYDIKKIIYYSIIAPNFNYCSTIYILCTKEQIMSLQKQQNRAMRIIIKCDFLTPREGMLNTLGWISVSQSIKLNCLIMVYKIINNLVPQYLKQNITYNRDIHNYNTRNINNFRLPKIITENSKKNIYYAGLKLYNDLPNEIKEAQTLKEFKKKCLSFVRENYEIL